MVTGLACPRCKRARTLKRLPANFKCADVVCDFCGYLAQVKTTTRENVDEFPPRLLGAAWGPQAERMAAGIYFPLFIVVISASGRKHGIYYLPADLQTKAMFERRKPLSTSARRAGWTGYIIRLDLDDGHVPVRVA